MNSPVLPLKRHREQDSRGSAVMTLVVGVAGFAIVGLISSLVAMTFAAHQMARTAADMAALAGAAQVLQSDSAVCAQAESMARANQSELSRCAISGLDVQVQVRHSKVVLGQIPISATADARAGPP